MNWKLFEAFIFNRTVLMVLISACVASAILDLFIENSQEKILNHFAIELAQNNRKNFNELSQTRAPEEVISTMNQGFEVNKIPIKVREVRSDSTLDAFQKKAIQFLEKDPTIPYYQFEEEPSSQLRFAFKNPQGVFEIGIDLELFGEIASQESLKLLFTIFLLVGLASFASCIFFGYYRYSTGLLLETQKKALDQQIQLTESYERFFPHEFLPLLDKKSVLEIQLGDQKERSMAVLFSDIRGFTASLEKRSLVESFQFIGEYLRQIGPIVRLNQGFIDKYIGDAILALFFEPDQALKAMIEIFRLQAQIVKTAAQPADVVSEIGGGMNYGAVMVGTLGEEKRMDGTVIGDVVNTASRIEELNKIYGTHILISEEFLNHLKARETLKIRYIDHVYVHGKEESLKLFEVFESDSPEMIVKKEQIQADFTKGIELYCDRKFSEALKFFEICEGTVPEDRVVRLYIQRTKEWIAQPPGEDWKPIARWTEKAPK